MNWNLRRCMRPDISVLPHIVANPAQIRDDGGSQIGGTFADVFRTLAEKAPPYPRDGIVIHAGAYRGEETAKLARLYERPVHAFEPDQRNLPALRAIAHEYNQLFKTDIRVHARAIADNIGFRALHYSDSAVGFSQSNSLKKPKLHVQISPEMNWDYVMGVQVTTLDAFWQINGRPPVHLLYADVEGAEDLMIAGGLGMLRKTVRYLFTEYSNCERYEKAPMLPEILASLPGRWEILHQFPHDPHFGDVLLRHLDLDC